jgi:hypothetical protein
VVLRHGFIVSAFRGDIGTVEQGHAQFTVFLQCVTEPLRETIDSIGIVAFDRDERASWSDVIVGFWRGNFSENLQLSFERHVHDRFVDSLAGKVFGTQRSTVGYSGLERRELEGAIRGKVTL